MPYTVIVNPMGMYHGQHRRHFGGKYKQAGWQGYRFDLAMVFDPGFDAVIDRAVAPIAKYRDDKYLLGYFTDNELPWVNDALDRHLTLLAHDEDAYIAVRKWYDERKGVKDAPAGGDHRCRPQGVPGLLFRHLHAQGHRSAPAGTIQTTSTWAAASTSTVRRWPVRRFSPWPASIWM